MKESYYSSIAISSSFESYLKIRSISLLEVAYVSRHIHVNKFLGTDSSTYTKLS